MHLQPRWPTPGAANEAGANLMTMGSGIQLEQSTITAENPVGECVKNNAERYLELLKKTLTDTVFTNGPDPDSASAAAYMQAFIDHCVKGRALTMVPKARLDNIQMCIESVIREGIPGDLIEAGVWRGGTTIFMKGVLDTLGDTSRNLWLADSFEGLPSPDADRYPIEAKAHNSKVMRDVFQHFAVELADVRENFRRFGVLDKRVRFLKGWFKDTLPRAPIHAFSVIRLDGDYYESTMDCLLNSYPKLSRGGLLGVDEYAQDALELFAHA